MGRSGLLTLSGFLFGKFSIASFIIFLAVSTAFYGLNSIYMEPMIFAFVLVVMTFVW